MAQSPLLSQLQAPFFYLCWRVRVFHGGFFPRAGARVPLQRLRFDGHEQGYLRMDIPVRYRLTRLALLLTPGAGAISAISVCQR